MSKVEDMEILIYMSHWNPKGTGHKKARLKSSGRRIECIEAVALLHVWQRSR